MRKLKIIRGVELREFMLMDYEKLFKTYYELADKNHAELRNQLLNQLSNSTSKPLLAQGKTITLTYNRRRISLLRSAGFRAALASAAVFAIVIAAIFAFNPAVDNGNAAWAAAIQNASHVESVHMILATPGVNHTESKVELWWKGPGIYRMEFTNGLVITGNGKESCSFDKKTGRLSVHPQAGPGLEMFVLGKLGKLFTSDKAFSAQWIRDNKIISSQKVMYRGEQCRKVTAIKDHKRYEYIINARASLIYAVKVYSENNPGRLLERMEVLDVNRQMPDSMFVISKAKKAS